MLYELNVTTYLPGDVEPYPLSRASVPSNVSLISEEDVSITGSMVPETIKTYVLTLILLTWRIW